jgi:hypothetical protein
MKFVLVIASLLLAFATAQEENPVIDEDTVGILSYVDINFTASSECVGANFAECLPHIEIIDMSQFRYCQENEDIGDCSETYAYRVPYITTTQSEAIEDELKQHWRWYYLEVIRVYNKHIWEFPFCINLLAVCPDPGIDWTCLTKRLEQAYKEVLEETQPEYWERVYKTVAKHEPFALWYQTPYPPLPNGGAIVSAVSSFEPKLEQYYDLLRQGTDEADTARRGAYYFQDPLPGVAVIDLPIPYTPDEIDDLSGGIQSYEVDKTALGTATLLEQQHFGFANTFTLWDEVRTVTHFALLRGPYAPGWCMSVLPPFTGPTLTPVPAVVYPTNEARVEYSSVPEGYGLARIQSDPLQNPFK